MAGKKSGEPSPESVARENRRRIAFAEGQKAIADVEQKAIAIRKNMARLRALREAKEAEELKNQVTAENTGVKATRKKRLSR